MTETAVSAGQRLRELFDQALEEAGKASGKQLVWDEHEVAALEVAVRAADRCEQLAGVYERELAGESRPSLLAALSGEIRQLDRQMLDGLAKVKVGVGVAKSEQHQRAVNYRWDRQRALRGDGA